MPKFRRHNVNNRKITALTRKTEGMEGVVKPQQRKQFKEEETKTVGASCQTF